MIIIIIVATDCVQMSNGNRSPFGLKKNDRYSHLFIGRNTFAAAACAYNWFHLIARNQSVPFVYY